MRRYQAGAPLTGARSELIRRAGVLADGSRIVAAGPLESLAADHALPPDVVGLGDLTLMPGGRGFGDALDKVITGPYSGGTQIAGTDAGIGNCPHGPYVPGAPAAPAGPGPR
jgi:hypothetical protein